MERNKIVKLGSRRLHDQFNRFDC